ncbi:DUF7504 family protein [Haloarcula marina]|uniref:DUF7504 family protein n=1 Tax=Haloarcula marina TaxID=2961574 RepID=UPI0020B87A93|nr:hypothetical protein [Halomicroarcula marina]
MCDLPPGLGDAGTVLVAAPSMSGEGGGGRICTALLRRAPADATVLWVTYTRSVTTCLADAGSAVPTDGEASLRVITVGDTGSGTATAPEGIETDTVATPADLTGLGVTLSQRIATADTVVCCFDSLTALLQYVDHERVYAFLHAVTRQLYRTGGRAHFHVDPTAHDRRTVDALTPLFDAVAEQRDTDLAVRTRGLLRQK